MSDRIILGPDGRKYITNEPLLHEDKQAAELRRLHAAIAAHERNKVAAWMIDRSYATGHGDTTEDLLNELEWQIKEHEREAMVAEAAKQGWAMRNEDPFEDAVRKIAAIRSRT